MVDTKKPRSRKKAPPPEVVAEDAPPLSRPRRILRWIGRGLAGIGAFYLLLILLFSFLPPPINLYQISESWRLGGISKDWVSWDAVSYTHLDVYKRQVKDGSVSSFDLAGPTLAISRNSMKSGDVIYTSSADGKAPLRAITPSAGEMLPDVAWGEYEQFTFIGWNGETVHGYVVKPWNYEAGKKYPVAFLIHGGPQGSFGDGWSYRWNPQTYAGPGYAVVMIDFHGSTGYGQKFTDAISQHLSLIHI